MKLYNLVAVHMVGKKTMATRVAVGEAHGLAIDLAFLPPNTYRLVVMDAKKFEKLSAEISEVERRIAESSTADLALGNEGCRLLRPPSQE